VLGAWLGLIFFAFQIYFDFSGYSDMARGLGRIFGFEFPENFRYPYTSRSITEFWRRWHITLSSWFREYVYIPLGGSRCGKVRLIFNLLAVWTLTGIWHGAAWNFLLWGGYFALLLIFEKLVAGKALERLPRLLRFVYSLFFIFLGWIIFAADGTTLTAEQGLSILSRLFFIGLPTFAHRYELVVLLGAIPFIFILIIGSTPLPRRIYLYITKRAAAVSVILPFAVLLICVAYIVSSGYNPFLYFRF
jgi:alginate O-acetyltransferase complex protein AlgI